LVGDLLPSRLKWDIGKSAWRYARAIKYILLFLLAVLFGLTRDFSLLQGDPLITFFSGAMGKLTLGIVAAVFTLSLFSNRFWCRNLCPAGAFLSLLNGVRLFRRIQPPRYPAYCDMGVETADDLDCLHCDRCAIARHSRESGNPATPVPWQKNAFALALFLVAAAFCAGTFQQLERILPAMTAPSAGLPGSSGKPRDINTDTFKRLMQERKLSDHPAEFSTPVLMQEAPPESGASTTKN
jgi:hypothetical protein